MDREKVIKGLDICLKPTGKCKECPYDELGFVPNCTKALWEDAIALLKEQEVPEELKQKMWNEFYAKEDEYQKHYIEAQKCSEWFITYRPWLQTGFNIAIDVIADWEGR